MVAALLTVAVTGFCDDRIDELDRRIAQLEAEENQAQSRRKEKNSTSSVSAYRSAQAQLSSHEKRLTQLEHARKQAHRRALSSARGCPGSDGFYFALDFLWWRLAEDGLTYAARELPAVNTNPPSTELRTADFNYRPGGRLVIGGNLAYDDWDFCLGTTYIYTSTLDCVTGNVIATKSFLFNETPNTATVLRFQHARARWRVQFYNGNFELGRWYFIGSCLSARPSMGLRGASIRQHFNLSYSGGNATLPSATMTTKSRFWGVGPELGLDSRWRLVEGFSFYASLRGTLLYGQFKAINQGNALENATTQQAKRLTVHNLYSVRPAASALIGMEWSACWGEWLFFSFRLGWEAQYFWRQYVIPFANNVTPSGGLSLNGLTVGVRFEF